MNKEQLIEEARKRGIVPGAHMRNKYGKWTLVGPLDMKFEYLCDTGARKNNIVCDTDDNTWAEVVTPAPGEGLVDGMACDPDEHMRAAIIAKAKELGMTHGKGYAADAILVYVPNSECWTILQNPINKYTLITPGEFYDRLCKTKKPEPPIMVGSHTVKFNTGSITVGCTTIDNATVRAIAAKLKD